MSQRSEMRQFMQQLDRARRQREPVLPRERARAARAEQKRERRRRRNLAARR